MLDKIRALRIGMDQVSCFKGIALRLVMDRK